MRNNLWQDCMNKKQRHCCDVSLSNAIKIFFIQISLALYKCQYQNLEGRPHIFIMHDFKIMKMEKMNFQ